MMYDGSFRNSEFDIRNARNNQKLNEERNVCHQQKTNQNIEFSSTQFLDSYARLWYMNAKKTFIIMQIFCCCSCCCWPWSYCDGFADVFLIAGGLSSSSFCLTCVCESVCTKTVQKLWEFINIHNLVSVLSYLLLYQPPTHSPIRTYSSEFSSDFLNLINQTLYQQFILIASRCVSTQLNSSFSSQFD